MVESYENLTECAPCVWYSGVDKKFFGRNQSYEVLTPDHRYAQVDNII